VLLVNDSSAQFDGKELPTSQVLGLTVGTALAADVFPPLVYDWVSCLGSGSFFLLVKSYRLEVKDALVSNQLYGSIQRLRLLDLVSTTTLAAGGCLEMQPCRLCPIGTGFKTVDPFRQQLQEK
jgi:hypothetical protein